MSLTGGEGLDDVLTQKLRQRLVRLRYRFRPRYLPLLALFNERRGRGVLGSPPLNSSPILLAQAGRAAPQRLDAAPAPVRLVEQAILLSGQREVLLPAPIRLALRSPLRPLLLLVAHMASHMAQQYARAQYVCRAKPIHRLPRETD